MPYIAPACLPCPFCESRWGRLRHVELVSNAHGVAEVSDCERSPGGGAILVWPKRHVECLSALSDQEAHALADLLHEATRLVARSSAPDAIHTFCSAGTLVGQSEAHMHFQVQPRWAQTPYSFSSARDLPVIPILEREQIRRRLRNQEHALDESITRLLSHRQERAMPALQGIYCPELTIGVHGGLRATCDPIARNGDAVVIRADQDPSTFLTLAREDRYSLITLIRDVAKAVEAILDPDGLSIFWETGAIAGHSESRFLAEIVPRFEGDGYQHLPRNELAELPNIEPLRRRASLYRSFVNASGARGSMKAVEKTLETST